MPHLILEYSSNIVEKPEAKLLGAKLHKVMLDSGQFQLKDIRTRLVCQNDFYLADGNADNVFVHLQVAIMPGRDLEIKKKLSNNLLELLKLEFNQSLSSKNLTLSVEIRELDRETYAKHAAL